MASWFSRLFMSRAEAEAWARLDSYLRTASPKARAFNEKLNRRLASEDTVAGKRLALIQTAEELIEKVDSATSRAEALAAKLADQAPAPKPAVIVSSSLREKLKSPSPGSTPDRRTVQDTGDASSTNNTTNMLLAANLMSSPAPAPVSRSCSSSWSSSSSDSSYDSGGSCDSGSFGD